MQLMADRMLKGLAQRLRLIGYDCALAPDEAPSLTAILKRARAENRLLVTSSRRDPAHDHDVIIVPPEGLAAQVKAVLARAPIPPERAFTRCSMDNTPLEFFPFEAMRGQLPPLVAEMRPDPVSHCPLCGRIYWPGTHTTRMREELDRWRGEIG